MSQVKIEVSSPIERTERVMQLEGLFDMQPAETTGHSWTVEIDLETRPWNVGLIVGPSGSGKSTIARRLWPQVENQPEWHATKAIIDSFPESMGIKEIVALLSSVGFSSPPYWLRPYHALSTGQKFRADLARVLADNPKLAVTDEYTSVVDRTVAQVGSHAVSKTVRARGQRFVAVTCHEDIEDWLNPDWIYRPDTGDLTWRLLRRRPEITLKIFRVHSSAWNLFKQHHYLDTELHQSAVCFMATWKDRPVAFSAWLHNMANHTGKREHRTVTLPDYQGVGIGHALSSHIASMWRGLGFRATSTTTHPAFCAARLRDKTNWILTRKPSLTGAHGGRMKRMQHAGTRLTAGFEFIGEPMQTSRARALRS